MKNPLGISPSKWNQGTTQSKEKYPYDLIGNRGEEKVRVYINGVPAQMVEKCVILLKGLPCPLGFFVKLMCVEMKKSYMIYFIYHSH